MACTTTSRLQPYTHALRHALQTAQDSRADADLIFLEAWEVYRPQNLGATLRARQIRRANPTLIAEIIAELVSCKRSAL